MSYLGDYAEDFPVNFQFTSRQFSSGSPFTLAGSPSLLVYQTNLVDQSTAGITLTVDFDSVTGLNHVTVDLSADEFYAIGFDYTVVIAAGTIDGVSVVGEVVATFSIENRFEEVDVTKLSGNAIQQSGGAIYALDDSGNSLPTAVENRSEIDSNSTQLAALIARLTAARAGYLDNLNIGENVAGTSEVTAIQNNTRCVRVVPTVIERPDSGTTTYRVELLLYDDVGNMEAPDAAPTIALVNQSGTDRSGRLDNTTMSLVSTGRYRAIYTATDTDTLEQLVWAFSVVEGGDTRIYGNTSLIVDTTAVDFTAADRTKLDAVHGKLPSKSYLAGSADADGGIDATEASVVQAQATAALNTYDPPTKAELDAGLAALNDLNAAGVRAALGMAAADLDDQLDAIVTDTGTTLPATLAAIVAYLDTEIAAILEDTGTTLPATLAAIDGKIDTLDTNVDAVLADTNELQTNQGNWATATGFSIHTAAAVWAVAARALTDKVGFSIGGTITTLDALDTALDSAHGEGSWATGGGGAAPTVGEIADAVWDELQATHTTADTFGYYLDSQVSAGSGSNPTMPIVSMVQGLAVVPRAIKVPQYSAIDMTLIIRDVAGNPIDMRGKTLRLDIGRPREAAIASYTDITVSGDDNNAVRIVGGNTATRIPDYYIYTLWDDTDPEFPIAFANAEFEVVPSSRAAA